MGTLGSMFRGFSAALSPRTEAQRHRATPAARSQATQDHGLALPVIGSSWSSSCCLLFRCPFFRWNREGQGTGDSDAPLPRPALKSKPHMAFGTELTGSPPHVPSHKGSLSGPAFCHHAEVPQGRHVKPWFPVPCLEGEGRVTRPEHITPDRGHGTAQPWDGHPACRCSPAWLLSRPRTHTLHPPAQSSHALPR